jgi:uncharacterized damage-inducible protein DinB
MFRRIEDFQKAWGHEVEATEKIYGALTDASLMQKVGAEGRSLGFLAWHIVITLGEMLEKVGLHIAAPAEDAACPESAAEIASAFEKASRSVGVEVGKNWTDETLLEVDDMYGEKWARGMTLYSLVLHQAHHRGQMTVLMRQAGLVVPGVYGPAKEEWAAIGLPAMP